MAYTFKLTSLVAETSNGSKKVLRLLPQNFLNEMVDCLLKVQWLNGPNKGKKGTLLISHNCKWPNELIDKADWLDGCFTPFSGVKHKHKLVLEPHPNDSILLNWMGDGKFELINIRNSSDIPNIGNWRKLRKVLVVSSGCLQTFYVENLWKFQASDSYCQVNTGTEQILFVYSDAKELPFKVIEGYLETHPECSYEELGFTFT